MAIDIATFKEGYPEFLDAPDTLIQAKLDEATQMVPPPVWGAAGVGFDLTQQAVFLYCARFLALSPYARNMKLVEKDGSTLYDGRLDQLKRIVTSGFRVVI